MKKLPLLAVLIASAFALPKMISLREGDVTEFEVPIVGEALAIESGNREDITAPRMSRLVIAEEPALQRDSMLVAVSAIADGLIEPREFFEIVVSYWFADGIERHLIQVEVIDEQEAPILKQRRSENWIVLEWSQWNLEYFDGDSWHRENVRSPYRIDLRKQKRGFYRLAQ